MIRTIYNLALSLGVVQRRIEGSTVGTAEER